MHRVYKKSFRRRGFSDCMRLTWNRFGANEKKKKKKRKKEIERGEKKEGKARANN